MSASGTNRSRARSTAKRSAKGLKPKLSAKAKRRLDVKAPYVVRADAYLRIRDVVRKSGVVPYLNERLHSHRGRKCAYDAETLLVGILLVVKLDIEMEHTNITKALGSLTGQSRYQLGLVSDDGKTVSYRSVNHQLDRLADALRASWMASDGTECDGAWLITRLLHASVPGKYRRSQAVAIDATAVETWGGFLGATSVLATDPEVAEAARVAEATYADVIGPANLDVAITNALATQEDTEADKPKTKQARKPKARRASDDAEPVIGPDGRVIHTTDIDARGGYRTATGSQAGRTFVGYHTPGDSSA